MIVRAIFLFFYHNRNPFGSKTIGEFFHCPCTLFFSTDLIEYKRPLYTLVVSIRRDLKLNPSGFISKINSSIFWIQFIILNISLWKKLSYTWKVYLVSFQIPRRPHWKAIQFWEDLVNLVHQSVFVCWVSKIYILW